MLTGRHPAFSDFLGFLSTWRDIGSSSLDQAKRPQTQSMLWNNVTMTGTWIETQYSNVSQNFETYSRIIDNVSLAMPHPGKIQVLNSNMWHTHD